MLELLQEKKKIKRARPPMFWFLSSFKAAFGQNHQSPDLTVEQNLLYGSAGNEHDVFNSPIGIGIVSTGVYHASGGVANADTGSLLTEAKKDANWNVNFLNAGLEGLFENFIPSQVRFCMRVIRST